MPNPAEIVANADALVAALNAIDTWAIPFIATREYVEYLDRAKVDEVRVAVVPGSLEEEPIGRPRVQEDFMLRIGVQMSAQADDTPLLDKLLLLCQQIRDAVRMASVGDCIWTKTEVPLLFLPEHLTTLNQFTSLIHVYFRDVR